MAMMKWQIKHRCSDIVLFEMEAEYFKEVVEQAVKSRANLWSANLHRANLQDADLRGANLQDADLRGADLQDWLCTLRVWQIIRENNLG